MSNLAYDLTRLDKEIILNNPERLKAVRKPVQEIHRKEKRFRIFCLIVAASSVAILATFLGLIVFRGIGTLSTIFLFSPPSPVPSEAGFFPAIMGSVYILILTAIFTLPLGIAVAILIEEFPPKNRFLNIFRNFVQINITNLAGVPSVVYGIVGLTVFASTFQIFGNELNPAFEFGVKYYDQFYNESDQIIFVAVDSADSKETSPKTGLAAQSLDGTKLTINVIKQDDPWPQDPELAKRTLRDYDQAGRISNRSWYYVRLPLGRSLLTGALTLMLVILPVVIIATQESLRAVPNTLRDASLGLGSTRWQMVWNVTLPAAIPGVMTGSILAMSRAIGEAAPLLMIAGIVFISNPPGNLFDDFTAMPLQIYNWAQRPQSEFHEIAASGIIVLLSVLLCFNAAAVWVRNKFQKPLS